MNTKVMTIYDQLILEGKEKGLAEGLVKGKEQGITEGTEKALQKTILNAYNAGIDINTIRIITGETEQKIRQILQQNEQM